MKEKDERQLGRDEWDGDRGELEKLLPPPSKCLLLRAGGSSEFLILLGLQHSLRIRSCPTATGEMNPQATTLFLLLLVASSLLPPAVVGQTITASVYILVRCDRAGTRTEWCVLLVHSAKEGKDMWALPNGGGDDGHEYPHVAAISELGEETNGALTIESREKLEQHSKTVVLQLGGNKTHTMYVTRLAMELNGHDPAIPKLQEELRKIGLVMKDAPKSKPDKTPDDNEWEKGYGEADGVALVHDADLHHHAQTHKPKPITEGNEENEPPKSKKVKKEKPTVYMAAVAGARFKYTDQSMPGHDLEPITHNTQIPVRGSLLERLQLEWEKFEAAVQKMKDHRDGTGVVALNFQHYKEGEWADFMTKTPWYLHLEMLEWKAGDTQQWKDRKEKLDKITGKHVEE